MRSRASHRRSTTRPSSSRTGSSEKSASMSSRPPSLAKTSTSYRTHSPAAARWIASWRSWCVFCEAVQKGVSQKRLPITFSRVRPPPSSAARLQSISVPLASSMPTSSLISSSVMRARSSLSSARDRRPSNRERPLHALDLHDGGNDFSSRSAPVNRKNKSHAPCWLAFTEATSPAARAARRVALECHPWRKHTMRLFRSSIRRRSSASFRSASVSPRSSMPPVMLRGQKPCQGDAPADLGLGGESALVEGAQGVR